MILFKLAVRELKRSWRFGLFFIFNFSLGLTGFIALQTFNISLQSEIKDNARAILSADLAISSRRELTATEVQKIHETLPPGTIQGQSYDFFAMLSSDKGTRLVLVKAIDATYPFYGELILRSGKKIGESSKTENSLISPIRDLIGEENIWIYPEVETQMNLKKGDRVRLGQLKLKISDVILKDQTQTFRAASLAPRVFIDRALLAKSGLIQFGSTFTVSSLLKLPNKSDEEELKKKLYAKLTDPQVSIETPRTAGESAGRQLGYLSDYLGLVSLVALFMSALGAAYIYRLFLSSRLQEIAILRTLGLQSEQAVGVYVIQVSMLGILATGPALIFSQLVLPLLSTVLSTFTPFSLKPSLNMQTLGLSFLMAVVGSFVISLPFILKIFSLRAGQLFSEEKSAFKEVESKRYWSFLPAMILFYCLAVYQSHSWKTGSIFIASLAAVVLILLLFGYFIIRGAEVFKKLRPWVLRFSFLSLSRRASSSIAIFVALGVGALLINILPQLKNSLQADFRLDSQTKVPSLFLFDIQDEQLEPVKKILTKNNVEALGTSPMIRARIVKVNDQEYERIIETSGFKTREEETDARFRNRGVNLSYREELSTTEEITEGRSFAGNFNPQIQKYAELSVEQKFAERMGFHLNDKITFDVQGVEIQGQIVNLRKVKWTSFQPNFFMLIQNGVLNEAPKTFILAVPRLTAEKRDRLQSELAQKISNVSVIDVVRLVNDLLATADKMSWSLELMAYLALITGYIVLFSIVRSQVKMRRWELNMLKILGAKGHEVAGFILTEFAFLAFFSSLLGAFLSIGFSYLLNRYMFESTFEFSISQPLYSVGIITLLSLLISFLACWDIVQESALGVLRGES